MTTSTFFPSSVHPLSLWFLKMTAALPESASKATLSIPPVRRGASSSSHSRPVGLPFILIFLLFVLFKLYPFPHASPLSPHGLTFLYILCGTSSKGGDAVLYVRPQTYFTSQKGHGTTTPPLEIAFTLLHFALTRQTPPHRIAIANPKKTPLLLEVAQCQRSVKF